MIGGEAGIGKTSLVRAFTATARERARVLTGACDDLLTPRTLGPFRDACRGGSGPLAEALAAGEDRDAIFSAIVDELCQPDGPTVLVVEDVHWADDATLDVLRFLARRIGEMPAVMVLTYRDDEATPEHPLHRVLGALVGECVHRIALQGLSREAIALMAGDADVDLDVLAEVTGGNPFFVTEVLSSPDHELPPTVLDAVLARVRRLSPPAQAALEQLAVVPSHVESWMVTELLGGFGPVTEAERHGVLGVTAGGVAFRHELARRAIEQATPLSLRMELNRNVARALITRDDEDLSRIVHHAVVAEDVALIAEYTPRAGREASVAGSHRQALAHYEQALRYAHRLSQADRAQVLEEYSWELYNAHRFTDAVDAAREAVAIREGLDDGIGLGQALVTLSRHQYMANQPTEAWSSIERSLQVLDPAQDPGTRCYAEAYCGAILVLTDRPQDALEQLARAREMAEEVGRPDLVALCLNYIGGALIDLGDGSGAEHLRSSVELARSLPHHEYAVRGYTNLAEGLTQLGWWDQLGPWLEEGLAYARERDFSAHAYNMEAHRGMLLARQGRWDDAERCVRELLEAVEDPGVLGRLTLPTLGRIHARRGRPEAEELLGRAWKVAVDSGSLQAMVPTGIALLEWAWLTGDLDRASDAIDMLLTRTKRLGAERCRGEVLRYLARAGWDVEPFERCPKEYAAGIAGDWRTAAAEWERLGDPYERALELADSGETERTLEALAVLDDLEAEPAAAIVRERLRELGVTRIPRGPNTATRANPAGLTQRQVDVLALLADGLTNAEIAQKLFVSTRTVDHHVSAILMKLGVGSRREAARAAAELGLTAG